MKAKPWRVKRRSQGHKRVVSWRHFIVESVPHDSDGVIAQLGERLNGIQEVGGSIPPGSIFRSPKKPVNVRT